MQQAPKLRMLVAGGCHVFGHPLGAAHSFTSIAQQRLAETTSFEIATLRVSLKRLDPVIEFLQREHVDVLVLQLGNFECPMDIHRHIRLELLGRKPKKNGPRQGGSDSANLALDPEMLFSPTLRWRAGTLMHSVYDKLATAIGKPLFQPELFREMLRERLQQIAALHTGCVIAIAPLPCAETAFQRHRLHGGAVMRQEVEAAGMLFLDASQVLTGADGRIADGIFAEAMHLSREGQRLLGEALAKLVNMRCLAATGAAEIPR
jgi:hypothetical protein